MVKNIEQNFPYPSNPLNEGQTSINDQNNSEILDADAAMLGNTSEAIEPGRSFTAPSVGGQEIDVVDRNTEQFKIPVLKEAKNETLKADEVGKIDVNEIRRRLGMASVEQAAAPSSDSQMHIDGRIPGQTPSPDAKPGIPAGAKPSKLNEMYDRINKR